jgi:hypothetical protein
MEVSTAEFMDALIDQIGMSVRFSANVVEIKSDLLMVSLCILRIAYVFLLSDTTTTSSRFDSSINSVVGSCFPFKG